MDTYAAKAAKLRAESDAAAAEAAYLRELAERRTPGRWSATRCGSLA